MNARMDARMDARNQAQLLGATRAAIGVAMLVAPTLSVRAWVGRQAPTAASRLLTRALGAREIALGVGTVLAIRHDAPVRGWLEAGALADASDALTSLLAHRHLPLTGRLVVPLTAAAAAVTGRRLASQLG